MKRFLDRLIKTAGHLMLMLLSIVPPACVAMLFVALAAKGSDQTIEEFMRQKQVLVPVALGVIVGAMAVYSIVGRIFEKRRTKDYIQVLLVIVTIALGAKIGGALWNAKRPPQKKADQAMAPLLNAIEVNSESMQIIVHGFGTVQSRLNAQVVPQVSGRVVKCHSQLVNGGFFRADEPLVVIEQTDYVLAVEQAQAAVAQAQVALETEQAEADVARREWQQLNPNRQPDSSLVLRQPQIRQAQAQLKAAQAQLKQAQLDLSRTEIKMPFNGRVVSTGVEPGQYITSGQPIAAVYGTDRVEIVMPLEDTELEWFDIPQPIVTNSGHGAAVKVHAAFAGKEHLWDGRIVRTQGRLDPKSRMIYVVAQVEKPFELLADRPALVPGMFVSVDILGKDVDHVIRVPRYAIHSGDRVWTAKEDTLVIKSVKLIRSDKDYAYVVEGLVSGEVVLISSLDAVTDGMLIRVAMVDQD